MRHLHPFLAGLLALACPQASPALFADDPPPEVVPSPAPASFLATGQPPSVEVFMFRPDHESGIYAPGETVTWTVQVLSGDRSLMTAMPYSVKADDAVEVAKGTVDLSSGTGTISATRSDPGVLVAHVTPLAQFKGIKPPVTGGAVFAPEKIQPSRPAPADFDTFWQGKLKELAAVPINPQVQKGDISTVRDSEGLDYYKVTLDNINGTHVQGQLARPTKGDKFPAVLILQYAGVYALDKNVVVREAKSGWLAFDISAHDLPIDETPDFYKQQMAGPLNGYTNIGNTDREKSYFLRMFLGCVRAVDYLKTRPDWDGKTILVTGTSQGGLQSFVTAGLCPDSVTALAVNVPAGTDFFGPADNPPRAPAWPYWLANMKSPDIAKIEDTAGYYDALYFAERMKCPALVAVGLIDPTARPTGVIGTFNQIKSPKELVIMPNSNHYGSFGAQAGFRQAYEKWKTALKAGQPPPIPTPNPMISVPTLPPLATDASAATP